MRKLHSSTKGVSGALVAVLLIVVVVAVVFLFPGIFSGLGGGGTIGLVGSGTAGVVIKSFTVDSATIEQNTPVSFTLVMENNGDRKATNVKTELFGLSAGEWQKQTGSTWAAATFPLNFGKYNGESTATLDGADPANKIPGEVASEDITLKNTVAKDTDTPYTASVRVSYSYDTVVEGLVRVVNRDYSKTQGATSAQGGVTVKSTNGPLAVSARTRTTIIGSESTTIRIIFDISNKAGGRAFTEAKTNEGPLSANVDYISFDTTGSGTKISCGGDKGQVKLISGAKTLNCDLTISQSVTTYQDLPFRIKFTYKYFVTASTSVTLLKVLGGVPACKTNTDCVVAGQTCTNGVCKSLEEGVVTHDLAIINPDFPQTITAGTPFIFFATVKNQGTATESSTARFWNATKAVDTPSADEIVTSGTKATCRQQFSLTAGSTATYSCNQVLNGEITMRYLNISVDTVVDSSGNSLETGTASKNNWVAQGYSCTLVGGVSTCTKLGGVVSPI